MDCYDLFSGCGGWSCGATQAGHRVVFACDNNADALAAHRANHPTATHERLELPHARLRFPTDGRKFHVHGSPPCTQFSTMRTKRGNDAKDANHRAANLVEWYLKTALASGATSWSMEQVPSRAVRAIVERVQSKHRQRMAHGIFQLRDLGVPQTRKRLLAGSPKLIARLKQLAAQNRHRSVLDVLPNARGTHVRSSLGWEKKALRDNRKPGESKYVYTPSADPLHACRPIDGPAPTVCTTSPLKWAGTLWNVGHKSASLNTREYAALQTFPNDYKLPAHARTAQLLVGNAVPPVVARLMMGGNAAPARPRSPLAREAGARARVARSRAGTRDPGSAREPQAVQIHERSRGLARGAASRSRALASARERSSISARKRSRALLRQGAKELASGWVVSGTLAAPPVSCGRRYAARTVRRRTLAAALRPMPLHQPSLHELLGAPRAEHVASGRLELYEYFAGAGGFCTGAVQAGCVPVYACDACPLALETHRRNHPATEHQCVELPDRSAVARLPTDGRRYHVHCSPPCTKVSVMNHTNEALGNSGAQGCEHAVDLIEWSLEMMLASQCTSWSLEQVGDHKVTEVVERVRARHPGRVAYAIIDFERLGVPQSRKRLLAAPPWLLARLLRKCSNARKRTIRDAIRAPRGTHVRYGRSMGHTRRLRTERKPGQTKWEFSKATWADYARTLDAPAPTVRGRHAHTWVTLEGGKAVDHCVLYPSELAVLQTFPPGYKLPERKYDAYLQVGNAVPPLVARLLLQEEARPASPSLRRPAPVPKWIS